jgi:hypothetical protein
MTIAQNQIISFARLLFRTALYLSVLYLLFLLGRGGHHLITSFSIPFGLSPAISFVISSLFISLFCCFGLLVIIHFFKSSGNE